MEEKIKKLYEDIGWELNIIEAELQEAKKQGNKRKIEFYTARFFIYDKILNKIKNSFEEII